ncbi:hypothetical protein P879_06972 [Paragonimus westermani]|uniref:Protein odr-4 n=1 Tax=Paragonimus westermani TaxID=34504 RepID=A0A8T0CZ81_9TREM|nr:hypothetical protein P879_06972 [Paragonimus westermani]
MIRLVSYEPSFANRFANVCEFHCGLLLGGLINEEEYLFLPIEIPPMEVGHSQTRPKCVKDLDERWVASHCRNLNRMIPGGVRISGLCLVASVSEFNDSQDHIRKILRNFPKDVPIVEEMVDVHNHERLLLLIDPLTKNFICKVFDGGLQHSSFRSVSMKSRPFINSYKSFKTYISLSLETVLPTDRKKEEILLQLQAAVSPYLHSLLTDANLLINGEFRNGSDQVLIDETDSSPVGQSAAGRHSRRSNRAAKHQSCVTSGADGTNQTNIMVERGDVRTTKLAKHSTQQAHVEQGSWADVELTIFGPQFPRWQRAGSSSSLESGTSSDTGYNGGADVIDPSTSGYVPVNRLIVDGRIPGIAFLPSNVTVNNLLQALRKDLIHSILARLELLTDELHITSAELEMPRMLLPQRVLVRLPACPALPLSDYKFISETADDVVARLHYFCIPMGVHGGGDVVDDTTTDPTSSDATSGGFQSLPSNKDFIDASCLDTSLEKSPEIIGNDEYSETELIENMTQTVQPVAQFMSFSNPMFWVASAVVLLCCCLLSFTLIGSRHHASI